MPNPLSFSSNFSLQAQRSLAQSTEALGRSYQRLASGQRINSASDDAAGLSIAERLRTDSRLFSGAVRNINDGISALNIMDSALGSQISIIGRLQELASQAANGTFTNRQRQTLNAEYYSLVQEFGRIGSTAKFNGVNLLEGGRGSNLSEMLIQAGVTGSSASSIALSLSDTGRVSGKFQNYMTGNDPTVITSVSEDSLFNSYGNSILRVTFSDSAGRSHEGIITFFADLGEVTSQLLVRGNETDGSQSSSPTTWVSVAGASSASFNLLTGRVTTGQTPYTISGLYGGATASLTMDYRGLQFVNGNDSSSITSIEFTGIETSTRALGAMSVLTARQSELANIRGSLGAVQSRLYNASAVAAISRESTVAAESRIRDIDVASEAANLVASQISQKTAASVLNQANRQPELIISLLKNI